MTLNLATLLALSAILLLFAVAAFVETRGRKAAQHPGLRRTAYTMALGVYCTSWTFYGAVGSAVREGWTYLPIYIAPVAFLLTARNFLARLAQAVSEEKAMTVSDFIAARFGHDIIVARLVTVTALLGTVPYIALQLRSIASALALVSHEPVAAPVMIVAAVLLALFAILFGARRFEMAGRHEGLLYAIAFESLLKITALILVAGLALLLIMHTPQARLDGAMAALSAQFAPARLGLEFWVLCLISAMAIISLPRQFYMGLTHAADPSDLPRARFGFAFYLVGMALLVLPIALAGVLYLPGGDTMDLYPLLLPSVSSGAGWLVVVALLGGISAAASMVIVDSIALATMVSNDLVFAAVLRGGVGDAAGALGRRMLQVRGGAIAGIIALALGWALAISPNNSLASIGVVAFAAMAQFTPHLLLAAYGGGRDPVAARASLTVGLVLWLYTLGLPPVLPSAWLQVLAAGPLDPLRLLGIGHAVPVVHGVAWSLGANIVVHALVAARHAPASPLPRLLRWNRQVSDLAGLKQLTASFVGEQRAEAEFPATAPGTPIDALSASRAQALIAGVVGASSARALVTSALAGGQMSLSDVTRLLDDGGQSLRFSRQLLAATFENIEAGISVIDAELNLQAWNSRYLELFPYPPGMIRVGVPVADLIRHNAQRGDFGPGDTEVHIAKRLGYLRAGLPHSFERVRRDGRVIKTVGGPMPGGGYVMSFTDITAEARARDELNRTLEDLEQRVAARTSELSDANRQLARAMQDRTRFLAAASHDLLQPLHAARLFTAALERDVTPAARGLVGRVERSIVAAEDLLRALLDISKIDAGGVQPDMARLALGPFLGDLLESFRPMAEAKGLKLRLGPVQGAVMTDAGLLRSVMQNFLANAVRYTPEGGVVLGVRRRGNTLRIDVVDSGVGIKAEAIEAIFGEFTRLGDVEVDGLGLGLALSERIVRLLGGAIEVRSEPGRGSRFSLILPALEEPRLAGTVSAAPGGIRIVRRDGRRPGEGLNVLVVDDDPRIVEASLALLSRLGHRPVGVTTPEAALASCSEADAALIDYRLSEGQTGLALLARLRMLRPGLPAALVTAETSPAIRLEAQALGVQVFAKPVPAGLIERFLARVSG